MAKEEQGTSEDLQDMIATVRMRILRNTCSYQDKVTLAMWNNIIGNNQVVLALKAQIVEAEARSEELARQVADLSVKLAMRPTL